jgi:GNAT superfamily N-acetyltransferase
MQEDVYQNRIVGDGIEIRILSEDDLSFVDELVNQAGWNQQREDWLRVLLYEPGGCYAAFAGPRLIGTVTTTAYGEDLGWIGMMLVHRDFRRRGIAKLLMHRSLSYLREKNVACIKLDATPEGQIVYEQFGFIPEWKFYRWAFAADQPAHTVRPNQEMRRYDKLDRIAFGADRSRLLNRLSEVSFGVSTESGFGMMRSGRRASYLGPVTADSADSAIEIVRMLVGPNTGRVFWDIPGPNIAAQAMAEGLGFRPVRELTRMTLGQMPTAPNMMLQFAILSLETG